MTRALDATRKFVGEIISATTEILDALTLACSVTHCVSEFDMVPRVLVTAEAGFGSGKSAVLDAAQLLTRNPWECSGATGPAIRARFRAASGVPTVFCDEASELWGASGRNKGNRDVNTIARLGFRRRATMSNQTNGVPDDYSIFGVMFIAGLGDVVPRDVRNRSIVLPMVPLPEGTVMRRSSQSRSTENVGADVEAVLAKWVSDLSGEIGRAYTAQDLSSVHPGLTGRRGDIWAPLFAVAQVAGGTWPARCLAAFKALALDTSGPVLTAQERIIRDAAALADVTGALVLSSADLTEALRAGGDAWRAYSIRELQDECSDALGPSKAIRLGDVVIRGWRTSAVQDAWRALSVMLTDEPAAPAVIEDEPVEDF